MTDHYPNCYLELIEDHTAFTTVNAETENTVNVDIVTITITAVILGPSIFVAS